MDFLPPYGQVDHPRHHCTGGESDYPQSINLSPYSPPRVGLTFDNVPYRDTYDQQPSPRGYNSTNSPYKEYQNYPPPPPPPQQPPSSYVENKDNNPYRPTFIEGHFNNHNPNTNYNKINKYVTDGVGLVGPNLGFLANKPSYKIYCKAGGEMFTVAIRDGKLVLTPPNSSDLTQNWYKDEKLSTMVKDEEGHPSFILVNKATSQAVKHSVVGYPVQMIPYKPDVFDESIMWTESKDLGSGFRTMRTVNNVGLVMDAWNADKDHGGIRDGTIVAIYKCWKGDNQNQQWKLLPY